MNTKEFDILVIGELNVDLILNRLQTFPKIGTEIMAKEMTLTLGSSSAIFASNASVLGAKVAFCGKIGADGFGQLVTDSLRSKAVDTRFVIVDRHSSTGASIILNFDNDRAIVTYAGAMEEFFCEDIPEKAFELSSHVHISSIFLQPGLKRCLPQLLSKIKSFGLSVSIDPQWDPQEQWDVPWQEILSMIDVFLPNEQELLNISGYDDYRKALEEFGKISPDTVVVVKRGKNGSAAIFKGKFYEAKPFINNNVVDAIGAGDSFNAGFIVKWLKGQSIEQALNYGNLIGAINTTKPGGTGAFRSMEFIRKIAWEKFNEKI